MILTSMVVPKVDRDAEAELEALRIEGAPEGTRCGKKWNP
jgi:hypothetical protein